MHEAKDREHRRFDAVACFNTSRFSRDPIRAALYERDLRKLGVRVEYAVGGVDSSTPQGKLHLWIMQGFDGYERDKIKEESKRGMQEDARQGFRNGGKAPYGYAFAHEPHPNPARARAGEQKSKLVPDREQAPVVRRIFELWTIKRLGVCAIAESLNADGIPCPTSMRQQNSRGRWAKSTISSILRNPVYVGRTVWNRLDHEHDDRR
jgi:DNA invertase Pin-like site-specific DNA recombinase